jgi:hypothetical protein
MFLILALLTTCSSELSACSVSSAKKGAIEIPSHAYWIDTHIDVTTDEKMEMVSQGHWWDWFIRCSPDGYRFPASVFYALGKLPRVNDHKRYFRLMGRIADPANPPSTDTLLDPSSPDGTFVIGKQVLYTAKRDGRLYVFANDRTGYYWNNWGHVWLTVTQVQ